MTEIISESDNLEIHLIAALYISFFLPVEATFALTCYSS
jgi:hypothetical protein